MTPFVESCLLAALYLFAALVVRCLPSQTSFSAVFLAAAGIFQAALTVLAGVTSPPVISDPSPTCAKLRIMLQRYQSGILALVRLLIAVMVFLAGVAILLEMTTGSHQTISASASR